MENPSTGLWPCFPDSVNHWKPIEEDRIFDTKNLYGYIDGGAELYLSYGFERGYHREYGNGENATIYADIFDMGKPKNAFGVFSHARDKDENEFGQGSQDYGDAVIFWKDRYYIAISSRGNAPDLYASILAVARHIDHAIQSTGELPAVLKMLPDENRVPSTVIYFNHYTWQNSYCMLADENILNIDTTVDAILSRYILGNGSACVLLVSYGLKEKAESAMKQLSESLKLGPGGKIQTVGGKWIMARIKDSYIAIVFNAQDSVAAENFLSDIINHL